ncbi:hypothetical protein NQ318_022554 [Aromia moschata]|uniref:Maturase K n=1 Tax=Aromia moschata TaxID=1265417 RepID=A0AAV8XLN6_9CUCU|nr:hypothetical protein NQ318_022554 [Aromia moschata]
MFENRAVYGVRRAFKKKRFSHVNLLKELRFTPKDFHNYLRMDEETYLQLLSLPQGGHTKILNILRSYLHRLSVTLFLKPVKPYTVLHKDYLKVIMD